MSDEVCRHFRDLGEYDYRPAHEATSAGGRLIDVDILGHIFEQSITDLERLRNELDGLAQPLGAEKHKTRRKKEGAFYTPSFITRYIVEQALGGVLRDRFEQLRRRHEEAAIRPAERRRQQSPSPSTGEGRGEGASSPSPLNGEGRGEGAAARTSVRAALADPRVYQLDKLTKPQRAALVAFWEGWQDELAGIRLLDPACGSGAFLIEAFDQLHTAYQRSNDRLQELRGHRSLFDLDKRILENNLYGVDLNEEAIEICRLSLWIKTAERGKALTSLDHPIRVGNSVVSDPSVHPKALDWQAAFPEVFANGGFDVVVGNPPYIRQEWIAQYKPHWQSIFKTYHGVADIFTYFFERGLQLLRPNGRLAFITSGSWVRGNFGAPLRRHIAENAAIESMIDLGEFQPFEEAEMIRPSITIMRNQQPGGQMKIFKWLVAGDPPENLSEVIADAPTMRTDHLGADAWELDPDDVMALRKKLTAGGRLLSDYTEGKIYRGVVTGSNEVFIITQQLRNELISRNERSGEIIKPLIQGTNLRPWYVEKSDEWLIFTRRGIEIENYPAILEYLESHRRSLEPKPSNWPTSKRWPGRKAGAYKWYEIQDSIDYFASFEQTKIVWPDITNRPRFSMEQHRRFVGDTAFMIPTGDYFLLGVLASWLTWFFISKTAQPLRLRSDRWQYRLKIQYLKQVPIPEASGSDRTLIAELAERCCRVAAERYELESSVQRRLIESFGEAPTGERRGVLNQKAEAWWEQSLSALGAALKASFKLPTNPLHSPRIADEWEPYLAEKRTVVARLTQSLADADAEINDRLFRLFNLAPDEIALLMREVEH